MALFQESVLKQQLSNLNDDLLVPNWEQFKSYFKSTSTQEKILELKEEEFQGDFLFELFDKCLGYTKSLDGRNLFQELKNETDSKKADGAIKIDGDVVCVIELKSSKTKELSKIEDQAFGYLTAHPKCKYVVTSNFRKLRFYIQNKTEFEEFDLFNLTEEWFRMLWLCLSFNSMRLNDDWQGADFLAIKGDEMIKIQLKSRFTVDLKYLKKDLYIAFIENKVAKIYNHDKAVKILPEKTKETASWKESGSYSWNKTPKYFEPIIKEL